MISGDMETENVTTQEDGTWCEVIHDSDRCPGLDTYGYNEMVPEIVAKHVVQYGCSVRYTRKTFVVVERIDSVR